MTTRYVLMRESRFEVHVTAQNNNADGTSLPFTHGWHPYFVVKVSLELLPASAMHCLHGATVQDMSRAVVTFDKCQKWNHVLMGAGAPLHGDLIPTVLIGPALRAVCSHVSVGSVAGAGSDGAG